uniref:Uncharacterized protein n=1 Tax=Magnetococcus massalia (strain MO-1) TaxID=451514 RepID=A0A1S7LGT8_MAGMO|nr:protein of unknown function [Candidatus Magnetococcus massalia]
MDQAAPPYQIIFRNVRKCGQDPNLDCDFSVRARGHHQKKAQAGGEPLHNSTNLSVSIFEKTPFLQMVTNRDVVVSQYNQTNQLKLFD